MSRRRIDFADLGLIAALFTLLVLLVNPVHDFPMSDDWEYARMAQTLLTTGHFYRSPLVQATAVFPAIWGAFFSSLLGVNFVSLRLSTLPLGLGTGLAFYAVLGELDFDRARRLLGALTLMVTPLFVFFANSFMTDVPFLFWMMVGLWLSLRALRLDRPSLALWGSLCAALAFLTRQIGLALPLALALTVVIRRPGSAWPRWLAASSALPVLATVLFYGWQPLSGTASWADAAITSGGFLPFLLRLQTPSELARRLVIFLITVSLYLLPLWLAVSSALPQVWRNLRAAQPAFLQKTGFWIGTLALFFFASVMYFGARGEWWPYLTDSFTKAGLRPFLAHYGYVMGDRRPIFFSMPAWIGLTFLGVALAVAFVFILGGTQWKSASPPFQLLSLYTFTLALPSLFFVLFYERYFLQLLPCAIAILLDATRRFRLSVLPAAIGLIAMGAFSIALMWDYWGWHEIRWAEAEALRARGVPIEQIDGGNEWDGWYLSDKAYAYIRATGAPMTTNPWEYVIDPEYMITFTVVRGYHVEKEMLFFNPFRARSEDGIFVLKREAPP